MGADAAAASSVTGGSPLPSCGQRRKMQLLQLRAQSCSERGDLRVLKVPVWRSVEQREREGEPRGRSALALILCVQHIGRLH